MIKTVEIDVFPQNIEKIDLLRKLAVKKLKLEAKDCKDFRIVKKSLDARKRPIYKLRCEVNTVRKFKSHEPFQHKLKEVKSSKEVIIVGAGPAGYFAALECIQQGLKPIVLDRGKDVQARRRDLKAIQQDGIVNPHSNYCFGEGGAGTYSDGKLYTRSHKRGNIQHILEILVDHGAKSDILIDAHPHIGSNKLPKIVSAIRDTIEQYGGEILFDHWVTELLIEKKKIVGVQCENGEEFLGDHFILATGHSARDIYQLLDKHRIAMSAKDFAIGVRIEHPQALIDELQYRLKDRGEHLPAASYRVACQVKGHGVFSFCMCPGGLIVPAATSPGELVVNGMSLSRRDSPYSNSGFVTSISVRDLSRRGYTGKFACLDFQKEVEQRFFNHGSGGQQAPAQRITDFVSGKVSSSLTSTSYIPGIYSADMRELLPDFVSKLLRRALVQLKDQMPKYYTEEAQFIGLESRTSAPVSIPRNDNLEHPNVRGLFPCGEGAGYAGGILSACMDGMRVAKAVAKSMAS